MFRLDRSKRDAHGFILPTVSRTLGDGLADGVFTLTLASGCTGRLEVNLSEFSASMPLGTTPDPSHRPYLFTRAFSPDETSACHTQFGSMFVGGGGAVCLDTWAAHLVPM